MKNIITIIFLFLVTTVVWGQSCSTFQGTDPGYVLTAGQLALSGTNSFTGAIGKRYKLNLIAGQSYTITGCSGFGSGTDLEFSIFNYASTILYQVDSDGCGTNDETYTFTAPYTGLYWLLLSENNCDLVCTFGCTGTITVACTTCPATAPAVPAIGQNNPVATDLCADAPLVQNLEGYGGSTSSAYTATGNSASLVSNFCGSIENNSFIKFIASATTAEFEFWIPSCSVGTSGVQFQVFSVTGTCATGTWTSVSNGCVNPTGGANSWGKFVATSLTVGNTYYLMFDGFAGNVCDYVVKGVSGLATCPLDPGTVSQVCNAAGTSYSVQIPFTGGGTKSYTITGGTNTGDNPSSVASGTMIIGPFSNNTGYTINISTADGICDYDFSIPTYSCPDYCAAINPVDNGTTTCGTPFNLSYVQQPVYEAIQTSCGMVNVSSPTDVNLTDDDSELDLPIGFTFNFFGTTYTTFNLHSNGIISFDAPGSDVNGNYLGYSAVTIPNGTTLPNNYIAGLYTDLNPTCGGTVTYKTIGTAPNRQLVVTWTNIEPYEGGCNAPDTEEVTFQIVLTEGTNAINTIVSTLPTTFSTGWSDPSNATQGVEAGDGAVAFTTPGRNWQSWTGITPTDLDCTTFQPVPLTVVFNGWYTGGAGGTLVGTANPQAVIPSATTTYTGSWTVNGRTCTKDVVVTISGGPTMTLGTATNVTACGGTDGTIPLTFTNVPNGTYTLSYQKDGTPATASIAVASNAATLTGLGAGSYTNFSISVSGCTATAAGPRTITAPSAPTTTGATICADGSGTLSSSTSCPSASTTGSLVVCSSIGGTFGASPGLTYNLNFSAIPAGATVTGVSYGASNGSSTDWASECDFNLSSPTITDGVDLDAGDCCGAPSSSGNFAFPAGSSSAFNGAPASGTWIIEWHDDGSPYTTNTLAANSNYCVTVTYAVTTPGTLQWYTAATGGTPVQTGSPFNPVGDAEVIAAGAPYSSLTNTNTPGTYTFYAACSGNPACRTATNFVINALPTITGTLSACIGATTTLIGSGTPDATTPWASASTSVATVSSTGVVTGVSAGTSVITYKNNNGCTQTATVTINALPTITGTLSACIGATTTLIGSGTPDATTPWASASTSVATVSSTGVVTGVSAGTSVITYKNNNGCTQTATVTINALPTITGTLSACIGATTTLIGSGTPDATTPWASASTSVATVSSTGVVTGVSAGTSVITYKNNNGCTQTATVTINALPTITGTLSACIGATTTLIGSGTPDATTPWASASTSVATVSSTGVVTGVSAGTSVITYKNNNGCTQTATVTINALPTITGTLSACIGATTTLIGSGTPDATTPWASASTSVATVSSTGVVTGVSAGTSVITYKNNNGCTQTATVTINALPTVNAGSDVAICNGGSAALSAAGSGGTGALSYSWTPAGTLTGASTATPTATPTSTTTYVVTVTDTKTCIGTDNVQVTVNAAPTATAAATNVTCSGSVANADGKITISGFALGTDKYDYTTGATYSGSATYASGSTLIPAGGIIVSNLANPVVSQQYTVRIFSSSNSGCYIDRTVTLTNVNCTCPTITLAPTTAAACAGSASISFTQTGGAASGTWTIDSPVSGGGSIVAATGVYTPPASVASATSVVIKYSEPSPSNCFGTHTITINPIPSAPTATVTTQPTCSVATGTITVTAPATGAGITYTVTGTSPVVAGVTQATTTFAGLAAGVYDVITTVNGCTSLPTSLTVNAQPTPPAAATASTTIQPTCALATGTIVVTAPTGAVEYNIDGGVYQSSATFAGVSAGSHTILVRSTADNTCVSSGTSVTVNAQPTPPAAATASTTIQPTCALATGTTVVTAPTGAVEYNIDGGTYQASGTFAGVSAGSHTILVRSTADNTCVSSGTSVTVNAQPTPPAAATASTTIQPTCALATGTIVVTAPTGAVEYNIDGGSYQASGTFAGVSAGSHTILVRSTTDNTCVSSSTSVSVDAQPTPPAAATASTTIQPTCATATGTVVVTAPTGAVEYNIDGGVYQSSATFAGIAAGSHTILVRSTADNTCVSSGTSVTVNAQPTAPVAATASTTIQPTCALATGTVVVTAPTGAVEYNIDGGTYQASGTFAGIAAGSHTILVRSTADNTCVSSGTSVTVNAQPTAPAAATASTTIQPTCALATGTVVVTAPTGAVEYNIDGGTYQSSDTFTGVAAGSHTILVRSTTDNTCVSSSTSVSVNAQPTPPAAATASTTIQPTCALATGTVLVTAPTGAVEYNIDGGSYQASGTFAGVAAGPHTILVRSTADNTCVSSGTSVTVNAQPTAPAAATASTTIQPTCALATGTVVVTAPTGAVEYNIDGGTYQASGTFAGVSAGSHTILVRSTADNTCVSSSTSVSVDAQPTPPAAATASTTIQPTCAIATGTVVVTAPTGAVEYNIDGGTYQASGTFAGVSAGSHTILVRSTADNTCVSSGTSVTVNAQPTAPAAATASTTIQPTCALATGTIVVTAPTGAVEYNIDGGSYQASGTFTGVAAGPHTILVRSTADNTCVSSSTSVSVNAQPTPPAAATASTTIQPTCALATGTVVVTAPTGAVEYNIDGGTYQASGTFAGVSAGSHTILVRSTADNTCVSSGTSVTVNAQPTAPAAATASTTIQPTCALATGTIVVTAPTGAVEYNIDGGSYQASGTFTGVAAGPHTILVRSTADNTCVSSSTSVSVNAQPTPPAAATASTTIQPTCALATGTVVVTAPTGAVEYNIDGGTYQASGTFAGVSAGPHTILVRSTTDNTCVSSPTSISVNAQPATPTITSTPTTCGGTTYSITVNATVTSGTLEYSLDGGAYQASNVFSGLTSGSTHTVTVRTVGTTCTATATGITRSCITGIKLGVIDPCTCNNDAAMNGLNSGTFSEAIIVGVDNDSNGTLDMNLPAGWSINVLTVTGASAGLVTGTSSFTMQNNTSTNNFDALKATFSHTDNVGYQVTFEVLDNLGNRIDANGDNLINNNDIITMANKCAYPTPTFNPTVPASICSTATPITLGVTDIEPGNPGGTAAFTLGGASITQTPATAGSYVIVLNYDGANDASTNSGLFIDASNTTAVAAPNGGQAGSTLGGLTAPGFPGCLQPINTTINVQDCCAPNQGTW